MRWLLLITFLGQGLAYAESWPAFLIPSLIGIVEGRPTVPGEYPAAVHLLSYDGQDRKDLDNASKCSGLAVGRCVVTNSHCLRDLREHLIARANDGKEVEATDREMRHLPPDASDRNGILGIDLAVLQLPIALPGAVSSDELSFDFVPHTSPPAILTREGILEAAAKGDRYSLVGFGEEVPQEIREKIALAATDLPAAQLGLQFRIAHSFLVPRSTEGTAHLLAYAHDIFFRADIESIKKIEGELDALNSMQQFFFSWVIQNRRKKIEEFYADVARYQGFVLIPDPHQTVPGDSGSPVFAEVQGRRRVIAFMSAGMKEPPVGIPDTFRALREVGGMLASPLGPHKDFIQTSLKELDCEQGGTR